MRTPLHAVAPASSRPLVLATLILFALTGSFRSAHATASATVLTTSLNPSGVSQAVTLTATVSAVPPGGTPTGTVTFLVNGSPSIVTMAAAGAANLSSSTLPAGTSVVSATYSGDGTFSGSASGPLSQVVVPSESTLPFQFAWGTFGTGPGQIEAAFATAVSPSRMLYVAERTGNRIQEFDPSGNSIVFWGTAGTGNGQFNAPSGLTVDGAGNVYVADTGNNRVQKFTSGGAYLTQWGALGSGNGQFSSPAGVAADGGGNVYVVESVNNRVQKFSNTGVFITKWGALGSGNGQFNAPVNIAVTAAGAVYVTEAQNHRVQQFTSTGTYVNQWGGSVTGHGGIFNPRGAAVDAGGNVYITENGCGCVQKFTGSGAYLYQTVPTAAFPGLVNPGAPAVDYLGNLYAADPGNDRLVKFAHLEHVTAVTDVKGDQGHQVRIRIASTGADTLGSATAIIGYEVYRQISATNAPARARQAQASPTAVRLEGWDYVLTVPARGDTSYYAVVPTLADSNASGLHSSNFFVSATTSSPTTSFWSAPDSGWSVDNLSPAVPAPFTGAYSAGATALHWGRNTEPDLAAYRVYRGASAGFVPSAGNLIATRSDTGYVDVGPSGGWYALAAVDVNGNASGFATLAPGGTLAVGASGPLAFALMAPRPNPSHGGRMSVEFVLSQPVPARIELLDVTGRRVIVREVSSLGLGRHTLELANGRRVAPGLYLLRLTQGHEMRRARCLVLE